MKRAYESPVLIFENFSPNEYVAACWKIACDVDSANAYEKKIGVPSWHRHRAEHCGTASNQVIMDANGDGILEMVEENTDRLGILNCTPYYDADYTQARDLQNLKSGETLFWETKHYSLVWHHAGTVQPYDGRPNHS